MGRMRYFLLATAIVALSRGATAQSFDAAKWILEGWHATYNRGLDVDDFGDVYMSGAISNRSPWSDGTVFVQEHNEGFLARISPDGKVSWIRSGVRLPTPSGWPERATTVISVAAHRNTVFTNEGATFWRGPGPGGPFSYSSGVLISQYSDAGDSLLTVHLGGEPFESLYNAPAYIEGLGTDAAGNVYAVGYVRDTLRIGPETLIVPPNGFRHVFLASYSGTGDLRWVRRMGGDWSSTISLLNLPKPGFYVDEGGNTYLGGYFAPGTVFGEGQPDSVRFEEPGGALVSHDADGRLRWIKAGQELGIHFDTETYGGGGNADLYTPVPWFLAGNQQGELGILWHLRSDRRDVGYEVQVGDTTFSIADPKHRIDFVTKHTPDGTLLWVRRPVSNRGIMEISAITMDAQGDIYIGGAYFSERLQIEDAVLESDKEWASITATGFAAHYGADGRLVRTLNVGGPMITEVTNLKTASAGELYVAGYAFNLNRSSEPIVVGMDTLETSSIASRVFLAKYGPTAMDSERRPARQVMELRLDHYPNPFAETATIAYELLEASHVVLRVYDMLGRELAVLVDERKGTGSHSVRLDASAWPSGVYLYRFEAGNQVATGRLVRRK